MMTQQEFYQSVLDGIASYLPPEFEDAQITLTTQVKNNDIEQTGLSIKRSDEMVSPIIYLESYYCQYEEGAPMDTLLKSIADVRINNAVLPIEGISAESLKDYETIKPMLQMRIFDTEKNERRLETIVHHCFGDFTAGYGIMLGSQEERSMSVMITPMMLDMWGITKRRLHEDTILADLSRNPLLCDMESIMRTMMTGEEPRNYLSGPPKAYDPEEVENPMFVLTSAERMNGAGLILNPVIQEKIAGVLGGNYYVLPSSVHEVLVLQDNGQHHAQELNAMVWQINQDMVMPQEILSDKVQYYDTSSRRLVNAEERERSKEKTVTPQRAKAI